MTTTVHDPVCHMDIDPATAAGTSEYQGQTYSSAHSAARSRSTKNLRNISAMRTNKHTIPKPFPHFLQNSLSF